MFIAQQCFLLTTLGLFGKNNNTDIRDHQSPWESSMYSFFPQTESPEHEMHTLFTKRGQATGKHSVTPCSTFRASCSHLSGVRSVTPCKPTGKVILGLMKESPCPKEVS